MFFRVLVTRAASTYKGSVPVATPLKKWAYSAAGFNKYDATFLAQQANILVDSRFVPADALIPSLMHDDVLYEDEDVKEALRRLPGNLVHERTFRIIRAMQLSLSHDVLPKEQWTKYEEDVRYLQPYLEEVKKEREEREEWDANN